MQNTDDFLKRQTESDKELQKLEKEIVAQRNIQEEQKKQQQELQRYVLERQDEKQNKVQQKLYLQFYADNKKETGYEVRAEVVKEFLAELWLVMVTQHLKSKELDLWNSVMTNKIGDDAPELGQKVVTWFTKNWRTNVKTHDANDGTFKLKEKTSETAKLFLFQINDKIKKDKM